MSVWRWTDRFSPAIPDAAQISLGEGGTPCIRSCSIGPSLGLRELYFKLESCNPTGSFKDRFASLAISHMRANRQHTCLATSSGNTGAALASYCAAASLRCRIAVVETAPLAKLQQMMACGAEIQRVRRFGADPKTTQQVFEHLQSKAQQPGFALQSVPIDGVLWACRESRVLPTNYTSSFLASNVMCSVLLVAAV